MIIIHSHIQLDFDGFASMIAAKKLFPEAKLVLPEKQKPELKQFLAIHRDSFSFFASKEIDWGKVDTCVVVDTANPKRVEIPMEKLKEDVQFIVYDHHPPQAHSFKTAKEHIVQVGAAVTLLIEEIIQNQLPITSFEATVFGLGLYSDTGSFTHDITTARDLEAAAYLFHNGLDLSIITQFVQQNFSRDEQELFEVLLNNGEKGQIDGTSYYITSHEQTEYINNLSFLTGKIMDTIDVDVVFSVVKMGKHVYVVGRAEGERVNIRPLIQKLGGNGHEKAASATIKNGETTHIMEDIQQQLPSILKAAITAKQIMSQPVKTIIESETIEQASLLMQQYGHSGLPVVKEDRSLAGVISRKDVDKALRHQLGHAPTKAYMTTKPITISEDDTLETIQEMMIEHNIGRLLVLAEKQLKGIISRSDIIEILYNHNYRTNLQERAEIHSIKNVSEHLHHLLPSELYSLLRLIGEEADKEGLDAYLIGGFVRDLLLKKENQDIDIVVEGDAIAFCQKIALMMDGHVQEHPQFGTATLILPSQIKIDFVSSRTEFYTGPAVLPTVTYSNIKEDLARRDFTINAMAVKLNASSFGELLDYFQGKDDLVKGKIRILHTLSFIEDPTRIFRAIRFAHRFQYQLATQTKELAKAAGSSLRKLSKTRLKSELKLITKEKDWPIMFRELDDLFVWSHLFECPPTIENWQIFNQLIEQEEQNVFILLTSLIFGQSNWAEKLQDLAQANEEVKFLHALKDIENWPKCLSTEELHKRAFFMPDQALLFYALADHERKNELKSYVNKRNELDKLISGHDLMKLGLKPSPLFTEILNELEIQQLLNNITTSDDAIEWVKNNYLKV
ncbi:CBS domain-containing protein [Alkalihalobacillus sp. 1P02AB]|uniref:CBS domain-containing protein n=1 Tax=Alkalihalobacillus sp. 1P02AB TaxID=3132260 RepID=UPI0039A4ECFF